MMEDGSLFEQSIQVKREANALLEETGLISFLQSYGTVQMAGSYSLGLMVARDIDVYVINPAHTQDSTPEALNASVRRNCFQLHLYYNSFQFPREGMPQGYYMGIKTPFRDHKWKVDIWFLYTDFPSRSQLIQAVEQLHEPGKLAILRFKQLVLEKGLDIGSVLIYEAVLQKHITNESAFLAFLAQR
jgi:hypothetical protein